MCNICIWRLALGVMLKTLFLQTLLTNCIFGEVKKHEHPFIMGKWNKNLGHSTYNLNRGILRLTKVRSWHCWNVYIDWLPLTRSFFAWRGGGRSKRRFGSFFGPSSVKRAFITHDLNLLFVAALMNARDPHAGNDQISILAGYTLWMDSAGLRLKSHKVISLCSHVLNSRTTFFTI